jgi:hypothetical protein
VDDPIDPVDAEYDNLVLAIHAVRETPFFPLAIHVDELT